MTPQPQGVRTEAVCAHCKQTILPREKYAEWKDRIPWDHHLNPSDCVAATARRCAEITGNLGEECAARWPDAGELASATAVVIRTYIESEFNLEPPK